MTRAPSASLGEIGLNSQSPNRANKTSSNNLTIGFYAANDTCADGTGAPAAAVLLSSFSYTSVPVCYNVDEIFASGNDSGWTRPPNNIASLPAYQDGVNWTLSNRELYRQGRDYTGVFIQSTVSSKLGPDAVGQGKPNERRIQIYEERDCSAVVLGQGSTKAPYYEISCSTQNGGECHRAISSFKSFRFTPADEFTSDGQCKAYYQPNSVASASAKASLVVAGLASVAAIWVVL
jgi:hypothetical protein